jgi:hypothetical protein
MPLCIRYLWIMKLKTKRIPFIMLLPRNRIFCMLRLKIYSPILEIWIRKRWIVSHGKLERKIMTNFSMKNCWSKLIIGNALMKKYPTAARKRLWKRTLRMLRMPSAMSCVPCNRNWKIWMTKVLRRCADICRIRVARRFRVPICKASTA